MKTEIAALLAVAAATLAAAVPQEFPYFKTLTAKPSGASLAIYRVEPELYRRCDRIGSDLRLFDETGREYPFAVVEEPAAGSEADFFTPEAAKMTAFKRNPDGSVEITVEVADNAKAVARLTIETPARDFDKTVRLFRIDSEGAHREIFRKPFFDYSGKLPLRQDTFDFEPVAAGKFLLRIENYREVNESPYAKVVAGDRNYQETKLVITEPRIDQVKLFNRERRPTRPRLVARELALKAVRHDKKLSVIEFSPGRVPLESIAIDSATASFARTYRLYGDGEKPVATGKIRRVAGVPGETDTTIRLPARFRAENCRLEIDNGDDRALVELKLSARGPVDLLFLVKPAGQLRCAYGEPMNTPRYDAAEVLHYRPGLAVTEFTGSAEQTTPGYRGAIRWPRRAIFFGSLALAAVAVGLLLWRNAGKLEVIKD
ncbi:MAG: hypothetical protein AB7F32_12465 [Victivallaceae bacterium]